MFWFHKRLYDQFLLRNYDFLWPVIHGWEKRNRKIILKELLNIYECM